MEDYGVKVGDVLWRMHGHRKEREDPVQWHAVPMCVEYVDEAKFLDAYMCGGSLNSIGKNYFRTREECLADFEKRREEYTQPAVTSAAFHEEKRLGQVVDDGLCLWKDDGLLYVMVEGAGLISADTLPWKVDEVSEDLTGEAFEYATLGEIRDALRERFGRRILTVWAEGPLHGEIYETGNYPPEKEWRLKGKTMGYA